MNLDMYTDVLRAYERIKDSVYETPLIRLNRVSERIGANVFAKLENMQMTGSFKIRGVMNKLLLSPKESYKGGIVTASSGNHGKAVAFASKKLGIESTIVLPDTTPEHKREMIRSLGAKIEISTVEERFKKAQEIALNENKMFIHPFDDLDVSQGQGTIAVEIMKRIRPDMILVPVGGGGLIAGIASMIKGVSEDIRVIGAEPENVPKYSRNWEKSVPETVERGPSIADGLLSVRPGLKVFPIVRLKTDSILDVSDGAITEALRILSEEEKLIVEPSSAISLAALLEKSPELKKTDNIVLVISGGNIAVRGIAELLK